MEPSLLRAHETGLKGICLTDHESLSGHIEWLNTEKELKEKGKLPKDFKCGLGNEIYLVDKRTPNEKQRYWHCILIAKDNIGHRQLRELSSQAWINSYRYRGMERVPTLKKELEDMVKSNPGHLIISSACLGSQLAFLTMSLIEAEEKNDEVQIYQIKSQIDSLLRWEIELFGDDCYIEIAPGTSKEQKAYNKRIKSIANFYNRKIVIGTDSHFLSLNKASIHKAFLNSKDGDRDVDSFYKDAWLMDEKTIVENLTDIYSLEEIEKIFKNSIEIFDKIEGYNLTHKAIIPEIKVFNYPKENVSYLKKYPTLYGLKQSDNIQERYWINQCLEALKQRDKINDTYLSRLEIEADVIKTIADKLENEMFAYFNTFQHYIDLFWDCGSVIGAGRGSSCSFLSNYLLGITQIDPILWDLPWFRFLNKERIELPDIDLDLCPSKRKLIFEKMREERGELNVIQVATFGKLAPKAAIATACRGYKTKDFPNGIDVDIAHYIASLIPVERGFTRSISDCYYGNENKDYKPIKEFIYQIDQYEGLLEIILEIENVVNRRGQHASGVILYNETPYDTGALMRSPNGDLTTQYDLHMAESCGDVKYDFLLTQQVEKLSTAIDLLVRDGYFDKELTKRQIYNKFFHPDVIDIKDNRLWDLLEFGNVMDLFQFNTQIGKQAINAIKPKNPIEMSAANGLIRLTAPEGQERPFDRYVLFKNNIDLWYKEMDSFGLTPEEQKLLEPYYLQDYGVPSSQEALMKMVMDKNISGFTLGESNNARKIVAKKQIKKIPELKEKFLSQCPSRTLGAYAWRTMMEPQMSYSFSIIHALAYSYVAIQSLVLIANFPEIYWNCACLIVNSQSVESIEKDDEEPIEVINEDEENLEADNEDDNDEDEEVLDVVKKKKTRKAPDYGRIAIALGEMSSNGIEVAPPNINKSTYTFSPDVENSTIRFGLSGIVKVGEELIQTIIERRPYSSIEDFLSKIKINKPQMVNLIKAGAFDDFGDRKEIMLKYIISVSDLKKRMSLQNMKMLIDFGLIPDEFDFQRRVYNFNKYLKKFKNGVYYEIDETAFSFYEKNFDMDKLEASNDSESTFRIKQVIWDKIYQYHMDIIRPFVKEHNKELLEAVNQRIIDESWNKYCEGNLSKWEMDAVSCYFHEHELSNVHIGHYDCVNFFDLGENPEIDRIVLIKGKQIPLFKIRRIMGTVLDKNKAKKTVTLLTTEGVVAVRIFGEVFNHYDRQISERGADGKKHVIRKSEFSRGNKLIITGIRREDNFTAKKYKSTPYHLVETIKEVTSGGFVIIDNRQKDEE